MLVRLGKGDLKCNTDTEPCHQLGESAPVVARKPHSNTRRRTYICSTAQSASHEPLRTVTLQVCCGQATQHVCATSKLACHHLCCTHGPSAPTMGKGNKRGATQQYTHASYRWTPKSATQGCDSCSLSQYPWAPPPPAHDRNTTAVW